MSVFPIGNTLDRKKNRNISLEHRCCVSADTDNGCSECFTLWFDTHTRTKLNRMHCISMLSLVVICILRVVSARADRWDESCWDWYFSCAQRCADDPPNYVDGQL